MAKHRHRVPRDAFQLIAERLGDSVADCERSRAGSIVTIAWSETRPRTASIEIAVRPSRRVEIQLGLSIIKTTLLLFFHGWKINHRTSLVESPSPSSFHSDRLICSPRFPVGMFPLASSCDALAFPASGAKSYSMLFLENVCLNRHISEFSTSSRRCGIKAGACVFCSICYKSNYL